VQLGAHHVIERSLAFHADDRNSLAFTFVYDNLDNLYQESGRPRNVFYVLQWRHVQLVIRDHQTSDDHNVRSSTSQRLLQGAFLLCGRSGKTEQRHTGLNRFLRVCLESAKVAKLLQGRRAPNVGRWGSSVGWHWKKNHTTQPHRI
jgi:hypothetical protein